MEIEALRIDKKPLVLCNTLFEIVKNKTDIVGYWKDENGKVYIDNINQVKYPVTNNNLFLNKINILFASGEKSIFYKDVYNYGVLRYPGGGWKLLKDRQEILYNYKPPKKEIEKLLAVRDGFTLYKIGKIYLVEIYK